MYCPNCKQILTACANDAGDYQPAQTKSHFQQIHKGELYDWI